MNVRISTYRLYFDKDVSEMFDPWEHMEFEKADRMCVPLAPLIALSPMRSIDMISNVVATVVVDNE